jgi:phosphatidylserine/phosphatidylglycerophosphate/cardiolipin synthase-like enzyme
MGAFWSFIVHSAVERPLRFFVTISIAAFGVVSGLYSILDLPPILAIGAMGCVWVGCTFLYFHALRVYSRPVCFENQAAAGPLMTRMVGTARRDVKILSFTSETFFNQLGQQFLEQLLDRGVELRVLLSDSDNMHFLRDDSRERYEDILRTYYSRWASLRSPTRTVCVRVYDWPPIHRAVIVDDVHCFVGTYYYPHYDMGDPNAMFYFRRDLRRAGSLDHLQALGRVFDYLWTRARELDHTPLPQPGGDGAHGAG